MITSNFDPLGAKNAIKILHLEDSLADHQLICRALGKTQFRFDIFRVETLPEFSILLQEHAFDLVLADYRLAGFTALDAWRTLAETGSTTPFILVSGTIGESAAVEAIHLGINDYLHKDDLAKIERVILRTLDVCAARTARDKVALDLAASERRLAEFAGRLQTAVETERASIAREIHDDIGGSLAAAKLDLVWIGRHGANAETQAHIHAASEMLQHAIGASQRIMMNLRPAILDQGLYAAVQWLAHGFERRTGIRTELRTNNEHFQVPKPVQLTAYRTAQEALTNASKYAECSSLQIDMSDSGGVLTVEIADNGIGISEYDMQKPQAFGIRGLEERAKTVGGWLDVSSRLGSGTSIILSIPITSTNTGSFDMIEATE